MVTVALASLLIGRTFVKKRSVSLRMLGAILGAFIFRVVYTIALRLHMPAYMLKLVSSVIVAIAIAGPYVKTQLPMIKRNIAVRRARKERDR